MNCMRCGRKTEGEQVFCPECLAVMKTSPVSPNATVRLPRRQEAQTARKVPRRKTVSEEEQIRSLRKRVMLLTCLLAVALVVIILLSVPTITHLLEDHMALLPGQNYSSAADAS